MQIFNWIKFFTNHLKLSLIINSMNIIYTYIYVILDHICNNNQQYIVLDKIIDFSFMPKIIRILSKDHVQWGYFVNFLP